MRPYVLQTAHNLSNLIIFVHIYMKIFTISFYLHVDYYVASFKHIQTQTVYSWCNPACAFQTVWWTSTSAVCPMCRTCVGRTTLRGEAASRSPPRSRLTFSPSPVSVFQENTQMQMQMHKHIHGEVLGMQVFVSLCCKDGRDEDVNTCFMI